VCIYCIFFAQRAIKIYYRDCYVCLSVTSVWKFTRFNSRICRPILMKFEVCVTVDMKWTPYEADTSCRNCLKNSDGSTALLHYCKRKRKIVLRCTMQAHGGWETGHIATLILILHWSGQLYASAALSRGKKLPLPIE